MTRYVIKRRDAGIPRIDYRAELNAEQLAAVTAPGGPLLVIAGAGSGKTRVVTYRVAWLVEHGTDPSRILLVTFTNKASREMLRRVEGLLHADLRRLWGGTFHHIGNRILREHAPALGYPEAFSILDAEDARDLIRSCVRDAGIDTRAYRFPRPELIQDVLSLSINTEAPLADLIATQYRHFETLTGQIVEVTERYRKRKLQDGLMDYDDLLFNWRRLMAEKPEVAAYYGRQFEHILVDEYQDTNRMQADIIDRLAVHHRSLMVVGDDAQSIYSWRGADFNNIYEFPRRYADATIFRLERNYRSTPQVLELANASIACNERQFTKILHAERGPGPLPALIAARDVFEQADFVVSRLLELRDAGLSLNEMAVLYRSHYHSMELQVELLRRGVPYLVRSGVRFFEQAHIKDVLAYLRLVNNPRDELAWLRALKLLAGIGPQTAHLIYENLSPAADLPDRLRDSATTALIPARSLTGWRGFVDLVSDLHQKGVKDSPSAQIERVLQGPYAEFLRSSYANAEARLEDIRQLAQFAGRYPATGDFLNEVCLLGHERFSMRDGVYGEDVVEGSVEDEQVVLSSVHQAKGLEWRIVMVLWLADGRFPTARALKDAASLEEERRLFYVAVTRARDELYLCYPLLARERSRNVILTPSPFIEEVSASLLDRWLIETEPVEDPRCE
ncbi:MAG: UvrD-helicase domain-containing protein [Acidobacteria bacterium]|nr:UvrD-helicase domain-containing protein [Acidobacteriota bacterium]